MIGNDTVLVKLRSPLGDFVAVRALGLLVRLRPEEDSTLDHLLFGAVQVQLGLVAGVSEI